MLTCDDYLTALSLDEAFDLMERHHGRYRLVAGATDILPWAREGRAGDVHIPVLIDIAGVPELNEKQHERGRITLGAATRFQRFLDDRMLFEMLPSLPACAVWFACDQIRESATIGGNLANASPAADGAPPMLALNAELTLAKREDGRIRRRQVPFADFVLGPGRSLLEEDELILSLTCDALPGHGGSYEKVGHRRSLVISVACVAAVVQVDAGGRNFADVRVAVGGVGPKPVRLHEVEARLKGARIAPDAVREGAALPLDLIQSRSRQTYRREVMRGFVARALVNAAHDAGADVAGVLQELEAIYA